jgi:hypothetical protein
MNAVITLTNPATDVYKNMEVVGSCNGVLCLCDDAKPGGAITLTNPATGDVLALPPIPRVGLAPQLAAVRQAGTRRIASGTTTARGSTR